jgi:hypothetical protein
MATFRLVKLWVAFGLQQSHNGCHEEEDDRNSVPIPIYPVGDGIPERSGSIKANQGMMLRVG